jgi:hypothetical protein
MKTILISGCSYSEIFYLENTQQYIKEKFQVDRVVNISRIGSSISRQIKAVIEWLAVYGKPELIIIPITHITRYDESIREKYDVWNTYDETLCASMDPFKDNDHMNRQFKSRLNIEQINQLIKLKTLVYNDVAAFNNFLSQIIMFSGWLKSKNINHLIFDMCNEFKKNEYPRIRKQEFLSENKNIIDIFKFCGNDFMYKNLSPEQHVQEKIGDLGKNSHHYGIESNKKLIDYLKSYIMNNKL